MFVNLIKIFNLESNHIRLSGNKEAIYLSVDTVRI